MSKLNRIPKGTKLYINGVYLAETKKDFETGYFPKGDDFNPPITKGTRLDSLEWYFEDRLIYKHPNFL